MGILIACRMNTSCTECAFRFVRAVHYLFLFVQIMALRLHHKIAVSIFLQFECARIDCKFMLPLVRSLNFVFSKHSPSFSFCLDCTSRAEFFFSQFQLISYSFLFPPILTPLGCLFRKISLPSFREFIPKMVFPNPMHHFMRSIAKF